MVDETMHGHELRPSLVREMLDFPLVLATLHLGVVLLVILWAAIGRFGRPRREPELFDSGAETFVHNTAELLRFGGRDAATIERYLWMVVRDVARQLGAPRDLLDQERSDELVDWLVERGSARGVDSDLRELVETCRGARERKRRGRRMLSVARNIHAWRTEILDGTRRARATQ
jgi:hypothetical protein